MSRNCAAIIGVVALLFVFVSAIPGSVAAPATTSQSSASLQQAQMAGTEGCTDCHFEGAARTTPLDTSACYECHPESTTYERPFEQETIHSGHQNTDVDLTNLSMPDDHPDLETKSMFRCSQCHKPKGVSCTKCHGEYHGPERTDCTGCHQTPPDLFSHTVTRVGGGHGQFNCTVCHDSATSLLERIDGTRLSLGESPDLCWQCHSAVYPEWLNGSHHAEAFEPDERIVHGNVVNQEEVREQKRSWMREHTCIKCHDPHGPRVNESASEIPAVGEKTGPQLPSFQQFIPGLDIIALVLAVLVLLIGIGFGLQRGLLSELDIDLHRIFGGISAAITHPVALLRDFPGRMKIVLIMVLVAFLFFKAAFGVFVPFMVVESDSMEPNIDKGDVIVYVDHDTGEPIHTYNSSMNASGVPYTSFGAYGDVVIFETSSNSQPVIHRAMRRVEQDEPMWEGGEPAAAPGYVTKGDNNDRYDPNTPLLDRPIPEEHIRGVALYRIPAVGWVRLLLPV